MWMVWLESDNAMQTALVIILLLKSGFRRPLRMGIGWQRCYAHMGLADDGPRYFLYPFGWRRSYGLGVLQ